MKIKDLVKYSLDEYAERGPINIVICGDSVSHGCLTHDIDYDTVYHNRLRLMINKTWQNIPVNVINTAVGGRCASHALNNFERDVLTHNPDLVIICFGLNDVNDTIDNWYKNLGGLFDKCKEHNIDCVYMTPNTLNTYVAEDTLPVHFEYARLTADMQNGGKMDEYMEAARQMAQSRSIPVCDCYAKWKQLAADGVDVTQLLCNRINHPTREMHLLFAESLFETIFGSKYTATGSVAESGMYRDAKTN